MADPAPTLKVAARPSRVRILGPFQKFAEAGALSSVILLACTAIALLWANSPCAESYHHFWETELSLGVSSTPLRLTLHQWINDGLMAVFFLLVGLEIKREVLVGELSSIRQAALPIVAAIGGMVVPALIYTGINIRGAGAGGWGIPMATDIAFALGILRLAGPHVPLGLKVFLTALAIVDDLGAVLVIALFYAGAVNITALIAAGAAALVLLALNRLSVSMLLPYLLVGLVLWYFMYRSGVHPTIAGVLLALAIPAATRIDAAAFSARARRLLDEFDEAETGDLLVITSRGQQEALHALDAEASQVNAPLLRLEHALNTPVAFLIMPLFALSNAGVAFGDLGGAVQPVVWGTALGLLAGKTLGIGGASWLAVRLGLAALPAGVTWRDLRGASLLGGVGFTMSLFVAALAFTDATLLSSAKIGVIVASTISGVGGYLVLRKKPG
jgi:NhaA family Na+:H+ antiporter